MKTLTVHRDWQSAYNQITTLKDCTGKVKAIISSSIRQPKLNQKSITVVGVEYRLDWQFCAKKKLKRNNYEHSKKNSSILQYRRFQR